jgi:hypothetical protein
MIHWRHDTTAVRYILSASSTTATACDKFKSLICFLKRAVSSQVEEMALASDVPVTNQISAYNLYVGMCPKFVRPDMRPRIVPYIASPIGEGRCPEVENVNQWTYLHTNITK